MLNSVSRAWSDLDFGLRRRISLLYIGLILGNLGAWIWAVVALRDNPVLFGSAFLAYAFGLRHAVIGVFAASWIVSVLIYRAKGYDDLDVGARV